MSPRSNGKTNTWSAVNFIKHVNCKLEPAIWSRDTGQRITCFDRCNLIIAGTSNIKEVHGRLCQPIFWSLAAMLRDPVVVVVVRTRPRAIPLAMITKIRHGFPFLSHDAYGAPLGGPSGRRSSAITENLWHQLSHSDYGVVPHVC